MQKDADNQDAMWDCECIAANILANKRLTVFYYLRQVLNSAIEDRIDLHIWFPLIVEALDLHHLRAANIMEWSSVKQVPYLGGPRNPDVVEIPVVMYHKMPTWAAS